MPIGGSVYRTTASQGFAMPDSNPPEINPFASPQTDDVAARPEGPGWDTGQPQPPVRLGGSLVVLLVLPLLLPLTSWIGRLPLSRSFEFQWDDHLFYITVESVPLLATICVGVLTSLGVLAWLFFSGRNRKVFGALIALLGIVSLPAVIFLLVVGLT